VNKRTTDWCIYEEALDSLSREGAPADAPTLVMRLRKLFPEADTAQLNLAVETYVSRGRAHEKLGAWAKEGFFSNALLQQASRQAIAEARAQHFTGCSHVLEIGTGTGSDTAALAKVCQHVTSFDGDPVASELARRNLELQGIKNVTLVVGDAQAIVETLPQTFDALFADPARRTQSGFRVREGEDYSPPLQFLLDLPIGSRRAIKVSPGLFIEPPPGWSRQFVGYGDECLEQTLWFGADVKDSSILLADVGIEWAPDTSSEPCEISTEIGPFLIEAHGTLNRCQYLDHFFASEGFTRFDPDVAYGSSPSQPKASPLYTSYRVLEHFAFSTKRLKQAVTERGWSSRTELKKRSFSGELEAIRRDLHLPKHSHAAPFGVIFLFTYGGKPWSVLAERVYE
jgi:SAM-dependent methyltransferase